MANRSLTVEELDNLFAEMERIEGAGSEIGIAPELAQRLYALEFGSVAGQRPWPRAGERTLRAIDPESGAQVIVSAQAPQGFIRIHAQDFAADVANELSRPTDWLDAGQTEEHLARAARAATEHALETIRDSVPRDSGELAASLHITE